MPRNKERHRLCVLIRRGRATEGEKERYEQISGNAAANIKKVDIRKRNEIERIRHRLRKGTATTEDKKSFEELTGKDASTVKRETPAEKKRRLKKKRESERRRKKARLGESYDSEEDEEDEADSESDDGDDDDVVPDAATSSGGEDVANSESETTVASPTTVKTEDQDLVDLVDVDEDETPSVKQEPVHEDPQLKKYRSLRLRIMMKRKTRNKLYAKHNLDLDVFDDAEADSDIPEVPPSGPGNMEDDIDKLQREVDNIQMAIDSLLECV